jgi:predicted signal transduction protein with EAL and GGDEF domain
VLAHHNPETGLPNQAFLLSQLGDLLATEMRGGWLRPGDNRVQAQQLLLPGDDYGFSAMEPLATQLTARVSGLLGAPVCQLLSSTYGVVVPRLPERERMGGLLEEMQQPLDVGGVPVLPQITVGVAVCPRDGSDAEDLIRRACLAATVARDRAVPHLPIPNRRRWSADIDGETWRLAGGTGEPTDSVPLPAVVALKSGRTSLVEALLRWTHPTLGSVPPAEFLFRSWKRRPWSCRCMSTPYRETLREFAAWTSRDKNLRLSVNLSVRLLRQPVWLDTVDAFCGSMD